MKGLTYPLLAILRHRMGIDGDGITTLIAGSGCPLHCKWCINAEALQRPPMFVTPQTLFERVCCDDLYFQATGGGVTFGGGEALLHAAFIAEFRKLCGIRWHIYAETSLAVTTAQAELAAQCVDGFIVDCKDMNPEIYHRYTGGKMETMQKNLRLLLTRVGTEHVLVRVPRIPEFNAEDDQERSVEVLRALGVTRFDRFTYVIR